MKSFFKLLRGILASLYKVRSKFPVWRMEEETFEHVRSVIEVFKWIVLPASLNFVFANFYFFGENSIAPMLWGMLVFFYSNFLPDLPFIYRKKKDEGAAEDLRWYKKYAILLFAPLLVWILFSGIRLSWKTQETFHDFKSLTVYGIFLLILGFFAFVKFPISIGNMFEVVSLSLYGVSGYLTHLKVDKIW